ncbi:MAG TPA: prolipoprotein diacylglyceryl transferase [Planctomycetota bacterium]
MWPFHAKLGPFAIAPGELFAFLGLVVVVALARKRVLATGISPGGLLDLSLAALIGGAVGARLYYFLPLALRGQLAWSTLFTRWSEGSGIYGGLILGTAAVALLARLRKQPFLEIFDAGAAPFPLGFAVGKLGCFLAGCCYGHRWDGGAAFRPGSLAYQTQAARGEIARGAPAALPVHPTQLYELAFGLALFAALLVFRRRPRPQGVVGCAFFAGYSLWRFVIEFFRDDPGRHGFNARITDSQVTALAVLTASIVAWVFLRRRPPESRSIS